MSEVHDKVKHRQQDAHIHIPARGVSLVLAGIATLLGIVSVIGQMIKHLSNFDRAFGLIPLVYVNAELSIPTIFSVLLLFMCALLLALITVLTRKHSEPHSLYWGILTAGFLFMTFDEGASIHELLDDPMRGLLGSQSPGFLHFAWVVPVGILVVVMGFFFIRFLKSLPKSTRRLFIVASLLYVGGAVGMEMLGGNYASSHGSDNFGFSLLATVEESLEMGGTILFIHALLAYLEDRYRELVFRFWAAASRKP